MPNRSTLRASTVALALLASAAAAADPFSDPFATESTVAPFTPCRAVADTAPLTLAQTVDTALCANPQTREAWANARAQAALSGVAASAYLPTLNATATAGRSHSNGSADQHSLGASLSWLLFDFGGRAATLENARQLLLAANATRDATVQAVFLAAVEAWYQVHSARAALDAAEASEKAAEQSFRAADARYAAGRATPADKLQAQTAWSQARLSRIAAAGALKTAQGALAATLGRDAHRPLALAASAQPTPPTDFERDVDALVSEARRRRPDLIAAAAQAEAARAGVDAARAAYLPELTLGLASNAAHTDRQPDIRSSTVGVTLSMPLFAGFATRYRVRSAEAQAEARQAQRERLALQVAQDVWNAYQGLVTSTQSARSSADLLASAEASEKVARGRYQAGVGNILELLNAQSALAAARQQRVQTLYNWNVARVALAQAMGTLDSGLINTLQEGMTP
ncbi:MAG: TolC family protein [Rhodocyclaceae bacterium]|nr:TolC family protein [Rhodocyclaceae bacterium]